MYNKLPKNNSSKGFNFNSLIIPIFLLLISSKSLNFSLVNMDDDFEKKVNFIKDIKPYFTKQEQVFLSKVQDVFDIFNKVNRITKQEYNNEISNMSVNISKVDRKEKILNEVMKYSDGKNKEIIDKVLKAKHRMDETNSRLSKHNKLVKSQNVDTLDSFVDLLNTVKPLLRDNTNKKIRKIEKMVDLIKTPVDQI